MIWLYIGFLDEDKLNIKEHSKFLARMMIDAMRLTSNMACIEGWLQVVEA
tara:strand:+ start:2673 stop:2822 length:150 start_codon:yes stop_codon:yes gene_type:complete